MKALVTGGGGFLGGAIVRKLLARGDSVRSFTRSANPWLQELQVEEIRGDLSDAQAVEKAVAGCDVVFHTAAKAGVWGRYDDYYQANVVGTENVVAACKSLGISKLVYTSTPSVVHAGASLEGVDESTPYATHFDAHYPATKTIAEKAALAANSSTLAVVALRPHLIWGPGDPHLIPRIVARAKTGKLRRIGTMPVKVDVTYVENAADAHLLAADQLTPGSVPAGKAYFLSDGVPVDLWDFVNQVLKIYDVPPVTKSVALWKVQLAATIFEWVYRTFRFSGEPPMTRFAAAQLGTSHWFDISAARRDFGYRPRISIEEGLRRIASPL